MILIKILQNRYLRYQDRHQDRYQINRLMWRKNNVFFFANASNII